MATGSTAVSGALNELTFVNPQTSASGLGRHYATAPAGQPDPLPTALRDLDVVIAGAGRMFDLHTFTAATHTTSLVVVHDGTVVHEWYADGLGPSDLFLGASMTKSVLACLVGRAVDAGLLGLDDLVTTHVPELSDSGYRDVTVRHVASMTTGVDWREDHRDPDSPASRLVGTFAAGAGGSRQLLAMIAPRSEPGTQYAYCTADSQVLDWVRERATGTGYVDAVGALWRDLGCTVDAVVALDAAAADGGVAMAGGGLAASARDWARIGMLQADGRVGARQLLSPSWVDASSVPSTPFLRPGRLPSTITTHAGFGLHWWPLDDGGRRLTADGSRGQFTYLDRDTGVVVVKTSQWPYDEMADRQCRDLSYLALPAIGRAAAEPTGR
ncbi:MAG: serine hydrolase [Marmoricola sp.]